MPEKRVVVVDEIGEGDRNEAERPAVPQDAIDCQRKQDQHVVGREDSKCAPRVERAYRNRSGRHELSQKQPGD